MDSCSKNSKVLLSVADALAKILSAISSVTESETVSLSDALGRVSATAVLSPINIPNHRNAAMDGYALNGQDSQARPLPLDIVGTAWAGKPFQGTVQRGQCVRILTGAVVPDGADTVVMQEKIRVEGGAAHFPSSLLPGENVRAAGEDVRQNGLLLPSGKKILSGDVALLAAAGIADVPVINRPKVIHFSTGDELIALGEPLEPGKVYDSNAYLLQALLAGHVCKVTNGGILPDDANALEATLASAARTYDAIITTGGASVGEADHVRQVLSVIGRVDFWQIAIKPGKPMAFGQIGGCHFFGLPGNPVAVMVTFQQLVAPALQKLSGMETKPPLRLTATCTTPLKKSPGREEFQRGVLIQEADGSFNVSSAGKQGSHILSSLAAANCFIVLPAACQGVAIGESVVVEPFIPILCQ